MLGIVKKVHEQSVTVAADLLISREVLFPPVPDGLEVSRGWEAGKVPIDLDLDSFGDPIKAPVKSRCNIAFVGATLSGERHLDRVLIVAVTQGRVSELVEIR
jgi:hypothetical protein